MRIIVRNLPPAFEQSSIAKLFSKFGEITDIDAPRDNSRRFCFIGFRDESSALKAIKLMNKFYIKNYRLAVESYKQDDYNIKRQKLNVLLNKKDETKRVMSESIEVINLPKGTTRKELKDVYKEALSVVLRDDNTAILEFDSLEKSHKAQETEIILGKRIRYQKHVVKDDKDEKYYNSLFFDFTTLIERICEDEKVDKRDVVDLRDDNLGARIAILESHLVDQTNKWLIKNGICLDNTGKMNKKVLLIRNYKLLEKIAPIEKADLSISPSKCLAIAHFKTEKEANNIYKAFMEARKKDKKIYCEFLKTSESKSEVVIETNKILIKNVPFQATENDIRVLIESQVKINEVRMPIKKDGTKKGYCFVEVDSVEKAKLVCEYFGKSTHLFGRRLVFEVAEK